MEREETRLHERALCDEDGLRLGGTAAGGEGGGVESLARHSGEDWVQAES